MNKANEKKVLIFSTIAVVLLIIVVVGATYAFFTAQGGASANTNVNVQTNTTDSLSFSVGDAISITANQQNFAQGLGNQAGSTTASATLTANNATNTATRNYYLYLNITSNDFTYTTDEETAELILTIEDPDGTELQTLGSYEYTSVGEVSGFDITTANGLITIADNYEISATDTPTTQEWNVTVTFVNLDSDQEGNTNKTFEATLIIQEEPYEEVTTLGNFANYITTQVYTGTDGENGLYYHDADLANGAQDNSYRYSGANPNNFVCFGATGVDCQNANNQYRIIGVFNNQVKLIKATSYGNYVWDTQGNTWDESTKPDIYTTLNTIYYNTIPAEWQNLIAETTWQVGGMAWSTTNKVKQYYDVEVGTGQSGYEETMKIGLMYVSDYGYGASPEKWTTALYEGNYGTDNWLYLDSYEWLISRRTGRPDLAFSVDSYRGGGVFNDLVNSTRAVRPSFSLAPTVEISSGTGTSTDPYILNLN